MKPSSNICCSFNNDRCVFECNDLNNCCILNICSKLDTKSALNSADILLVDVSNVSSTFDVSSVLDPFDVSSVLDPFDVSSVLDPFDVSSVLDPSDPLLCDIEIPQFPVKINVNELDEIPTLDELLEASVTNIDLGPSDADHNSNKNLSHDELQNVMLDIEDTVNFNSMDEGLNALDDPNIIFSRIQTAFDTFKEKTGRQMTYNEMRHMMG
jgi:hypothetical protein